MVLRILKGKRGRWLHLGDSVVYDDVANRIEQHFGIEVSANERDIIRDLFTVSTRRWTPEFQRTYQPTRGGAPHRGVILRSQRTLWHATAASS